ASAIKVEWYNVRKEGVKNLNLDCTKLNSISAEAGNVLKDIREDIVNIEGNFVMENIPPNIQEELKADNLDILMQEVISQINDDSGKRMKTVSERSSGSTTVYFSYKDKWSPQSVAPLDKTWLDQHPGIEKIVMNFKEVKDIPEDGVRMLYGLREEMSKHNVDVELQM
ncbi:MAG: hypothetical protein LBV52_02035, partial [Spirochaetaceae bacterium]|nr:hypothetical protein [Spirochaetaceae bacterium]